jgi:hypothetical protein
MLAFLADENFNGRIVRGLRLRLPEVDVARVQDVALSGADDPEVLAWAASTGWIVLTHDAKSMVGFAHDRVARGLPMAGVIQVDDMLPVGAVIDELLLVAQCGTPPNFENQVAYLSP